MQDDMLNEIRQSRPLIISTILGLLLIPVLGMINSYSPPVTLAPEGYNSVILAFEFVSDLEELGQVLSPLSLAEINSLDKLNKVDFAFMILYGVFLLSIIMKLRELHNHHWLKYIAGLVIIAVASDFLENLQLLKLTELFRSGDTSVQSTIDQLALFTWLKWLLLAIIIGSIGYSLIISDRHKWFGYALFIPIVIGVSALSIRTPMIEDTFGTSIFMSFMILWLLSLLYKKQLDVSYKS
jgi:hypothetical protein